MTILGRKVLRLFVGGSVVERQVCDLMIALQLLEHVVGSDFSALINRVKQFGFEPKDMH